MRITRSASSILGPDSTGNTSPFGLVLSSAFAAFLAVVAFHLSMVASSAPPSPDERQAIDRAVQVLAAKGFDRETFLLRHTVTFRSTDNWLNLLTEKENAFAATNFPFQIVTLYPDFYERASDDTERAMILLHEAQHLMANDEPAAYEYVWRHREQLGWTQTTYGTTGTYVSIEQQTRELAPQLFICPSNIWNDCTGTLRAQNLGASSAAPTN